MSIKLKHIIVYLLICMLCINNISVIIPYAINNVVNSEENTEDNEDTYDDSEIEDEDSNEDDSTNDENEDDNTDEDEDDDTKEDNDNTQEAIKNTTTEVSSSFTESSTETISTTESNKQSDTTNDNSKSESNTDTDTDEDTSEDMPEEDDETDDSDSDNEEDNEDTDDEEDDESIVYTSESDEIKQASKILKKTKQTFKHKNIVNIEQYITIMNSRFLMSNSKYNKKKEIYYNQTLNTKYWVDNKNDINYQFDNNNWYIAADDADYSSEDLIDITDYFDYIYKYDETNETEFNNFDCYVLDLLNICDEDSEQPYYIEAEDECYTLYIDKSNYNIRGIEVSSSEGNMELSISYPNKLTIPRSISHNSLVINNTKFNEHNILYQVVTNNNYSYAKIIGYTGSTKKINIPDTVSYKNIKLKVQSIDKKSFMDNTSIMYVTIGKNIKTIKELAFYNCSNLKNIKINSKNIKSIGANAFTTRSTKLSIKTPKSKTKKYNRLINNSSKIRTYIKVS